MIKKSLLVLPIILFFSACTTNQSVVKRSDYIINGSSLNNINDNNEVVISYEEYLKTYENKDLQKDEELSDPIITPEEYKEMISQSSNTYNKPSKKIYSAKNNKEVKTALMDFYNEWKHVRYKFGGNSKKGIDCSAFTQRIFDEKFNIKIPRSTRTQVTSGAAIKKSQLKLGDLVFFKTGKYDRHVGIYIGDGTFMHASIKESN